MGRFVKLCILIMLVGVKSTFGQVIKLEKSNNTYKVHCKLNTIPMDFTFDTGCEDVTISSIEASFLIKSGLLSVEDFGERVEFSNASGKTDTCIKIIIKRLEIGEIVLENVEGSIINEVNAPLLFGQTAIKKLGPILLNFEKDEIIVINNF